MNNRNFLQRTKIAFFKASVAAIGAGIGNEIGKWCGLLNQSDNSEFYLGLYVLLTFMLEYAKNTQPVADRQNRP